MAKIYRYPERTRLWQQSPKGKDSLKKAYQRWANSKHGKEYRKKYNLKYKYLKDAIPIRKRVAKKYWNSLGGRFSSYKSCARKRGIKFKLTLDQFAKYWNKPCNYCGDMIVGIGIDRVNNSIGYTVWNIVPCCKFCNIAKLGRSSKQYIEHCKKVVKFAKTK